MARFFSRPAGMTPGTNLVKWLGVVFVVLHLWKVMFSQAPITWIWAGCLLYLCSIALYWWALDANRRRPLSAVFSPDTPEHLVTSGPYAYVRHPLYTSYLLAWLAGVIASGEPWLLVTFVAMALIYRRAVQQEEGKFEASQLSAAYQAYRARTGAFLPRLTRE
ncbi:MAG TPA: isoprenylcysteine carboxylmethyltransferase family protein [Bryobacteraceae bacterium]|nr:isoprenylcysteine carboxylmethyltransferase family protein [Bryobacteraceae bacterium]